MPELKVTSTASGDTGPIRMKLVGSLTIAQANSLKEALVESLQGGREVRIDLSEVEEMDLSALQLLCAAHRCATEAGTKLGVEDASEAFHSVVEYAGFKRHLGCRHDASSSCIWVGGES